MTGKYNFPKGTRAAGYDNLPEHPHVLIPIVRYQGRVEEADAAMWNSGKQCYWVHFKDGRRRWVAETELVWIRKLI